MNYIDKNHTGHICGKHFDTFADALDEAIKNVDCDGAKQEFVITRYETYADIIVAGKLRDGDCAAKNTRSYDIGREAVKAAVNNLVALFERVDKVSCKMHTEPSL